MSQDLHTYVSADFERIGIDESRRGVSFARKSSYLRGLFYGFDFGDEAAIWRTVVFSRGLASSGEY